MGGNQVVEGEVRLKQQQNLYETTRAERNVHSKNLIAAQDEILDLRRKLKFLVCSHTLAWDALACQCCHIMMTCPRRKRSASSLV